jgi:hypothetical protein
MRGDLLNNGWCELQLRDDGGFGLTYLDWLGARRCQVDFTGGPAPGGAVRMDSLRIFPRQERPEQEPSLAPDASHSPR